ncbi:MAG TPA: CHAT domain-containing protein [Nocardioides sp.]|nr:CHAT domain-containing protein [Nocardioides sp.]
MSERSAGVAEQRAAAAELLRTMFGDIRAAQAEAESLRRSRDLVVQSYARQVIGIALREHGDLPGAFRELRAAVRLAERAGAKARRADAQATLGATLATAGRTREGLEHLDEAIAVLSGHDRATALTRRGWVHITLQGRFAEGAADMEKAVERFAADGDHVWQARALNLLGYASLYLGDLAAADRHFADSGRLSEDLGEDFSRAVTVQNRGYVSYLKGDLPRTFAMLNQAAAAFDATGGRTADLVIDQCTAYLAAGLLPEATEVIETALASRAWVPKEQAELLATRAQVARAAGDDSGAEQAASRAARALHRQGRDWFAARAEFVALTARHSRVHRITPALRRDALALVETSRELRIPEHTQVLLLAATIVQARDPDTADRLLREAERAKRYDAPLTRALGWLATARRQAADDRTAATLRACEQGLTAIDEHQRLLGSGELRALATARGQDLATLALTAAVRSRRPQQVLHWAERWRSTTTATAGTRAGHVHDEDTARDLAALRAQTQQANTARDAGLPTEHFDRHIATLERRIRERHLVRTGAGGTACAGPDDRVDVPRLLTALADHDTALVELLNLDGDLHVVTAHNGRVRVTHVGPLEKAVQAQEYARYLLSRAGRGQPAGLAQAGVRLQAALLGDVRVPGDGPVVVSAPNQLQRLPWALLPAMADRPVSSAPSAHSWLRASGQRPAGKQRAFIVGPGLASGGAEVDAIRRTDPTATYLTGAAPTVAASLAQIDGAELVHIAAHGNFRRDNPLFSSIDLADGPLMVHDLERLTQPPHRVVLSACETGDMQPVGADELLGLSVSLLAMGTAGVISSLVKVHDHATADVMPHVHDALRRGENGAAAMLHARRNAADDALLLATAVSFTAFGT